MKTGELISTRLGFLKTKIHEVLSDDPIRPVLQHVYFENGRVVGTDEMILVEQCLYKIHDFTDEEKKCVDGKMLHKSDLKMLEKCDIVSFYENGILGQLKKSKASVWCEFRDIGVSYVKWKNVIPSEKEKVDIYGLRPDLINRLSKAMGCKHAMKMQFFGNKKGTIITISDETVGDQYGLLMPYNVEN